MSKRLLTNQNQKKLRNPKTKRKNLFLGLVLLIFFGFGIWCREELYPSRTTPPSHSPMERSEEMLPI